MFTKICQLVQNSERGFDDNIKESNGLTDSDPILVGMLRDKILSVQNTRIQGGAEHLNQHFALSYVIYFL